MLNSNSSDLSMNWALDRLSNTKRSAREVFNNPHLKQANRYICIGCVELAKQFILDYEMNKEQTILEHVNHDEHPFFRRGKKQQHYERCRFRNPDATVISLAKQNGIDVDERSKVLRILTSARLVRKVGNPHGYSRRAYLMFFTHPPHQKFYYYLSTLLKDYEVTTFRHHLSSFYVETETGEKVKFADFFGFQDDVIKQVEKHSSTCLAIVIGTVSKVLHKGHVLIEFTASTDEKNGNTKPFRLFVHQDNVNKVGNVRLLEGEKIACYGFAEKKFLAHGVVYQMELYSIQHQIFFFEGSPTQERIGSLDELDDPADFVIQECIGFASRYWGIEKMSEQAAGDLFVNNQYVQWGHLQAQLKQVEPKRKAFQEFMNDWDNRNARIENHQQQFKEYHNVLQRTKDTHLNESAKLSSKLGFNRKIRGELETEIVRLEREIHDMEQKVSNLQMERDQKNNTKEQWAQWHQSLQQLEKDASIAELSTKKEEKIKQLLSQFDSQLFHIPIKHPKWKLILGFYSSLEEEDVVSVSSVLQLYVIQGQAWWPADHPLQEQVIEHKVSISELNSSPREAIKGFYNKLGNTILERIQVLGWSATKRKCPQCSGSMKLQQYRNALYLICWNSKCPGKHELTW